MATTTFYINCSLESENSGMWYYSIFLTMHVYIVYYVRIKMKTYRIKWDVLKRKYNDIEISKISKIKQIKQ